MATPWALTFLIGIALIYFALRGWQSKYASFKA